MTRAKVDLARKRFPVFFWLQSTKWCNCDISRESHQKKERERPRMKGKKTGLRSLVEEDLRAALLVLRFLIEIDGRDPIVLDRQFPRREPTNEALFCSHCSITRSEEKNLEKGHERKAKEKALRSFLVFCRFVQTWGASSMVQSNLVGWYRTFIIISHGLYIFWAV